MALQGRVLRLDRVSSEHFQKRPLTAVALVGRGYPAELL